MNRQNIHGVFGALVAALLFTTLAPQAVAGPQRQQVYRPVTEMSEAQSLPVGSKIALSCDNGGPVTVVIVDKDRSYLKGFTCPVSKRVYHAVTGGRSGSVKTFTYESDGGYTAHLLTLGKS